MKRFDHNSTVFELSTEIEKLVQDSTLNLAHIECLNCNSCSNRIDMFGEYTLSVSANQSILVSCKRCALSRLAKNVELPKSKQMKSINHRLSSRQKEKLAVRILATNIEPEKLIAGENSQVLERLALEIKCSPKALINYLNKKLIKLTSQQQKQQEATNKNAESKQSPAFTKMIDDLQKLDKILAPNVCPFGARATRTARKTVNGCGEDINISNNHLIGSVI
jgi:hypothetical protein